MAFWTYVVRSVPTGRLYIGQTIDQEHSYPESLWSRFTKGIPGPWILVHYEQSPTRSEAYRRERWLKTGKGREYLKQIVKPGC
jgi:putative endonuclease